MIKWTAIAAGALLALAIGCGLLLRLLFDPNDYRTRIELAFNERTGRVLELEGDLRLRLLPRLAVSTGPFSVSERAEGAEGDFLTAEDARLGLALLPLLRRRVELGELVLIEPVVALRIDAAGRDNWSDLFERAAPPAEEPQAEPGESPVRAFRIDSLAIKRGRLSLQDAGRPRRLQLSDLELEAGPLAPDAATAVRASFALEDGERVMLRSLLRGRVERGRPGFWTVEDLDGEFELPARDVAQRAPTQARLEIPRLTADLEARRYSAPELRYRLGNARGEASLEARRGEAGLTVAGPITLERTDLRSLLSALGIGLPTFANPQAPGAIELKATLRSGQGVALRGIVAVLGAMRLTGSVEIGPGPAALLRFDLRGDRLRLDDYLPRSGAAGGATAAGRPAGGNDGLRKLDASGQLAFGRATFAGVELANLEANVALRGGALEIDPLRASVFGGSSQTRLRYELAAPVPRLTLEQRLLDVDTAALMDQLLDQRRVSGRGTLNAQLTGSGRSRQALLASLSGPFDVRVRDGRVNGIDVWGEIERALAAARGTTAPSPSGAPYTPFDRFEAAGRLEGRSIRNDRFELANAQLRARGAGTIDYGSGALDLALTARLLEAPQGTLAGISLDRLVGVDIPLTVRGTMKEPRVRPDVERLVEAAAQQQLKQEGEKLEKKLKDKLDETLRDLLGQ